MTAELSIRFSDGRTQRLALVPGKYLVGRDVGDIVLHDPGVSTRHAEIEVRADVVTLTDLGSTNGTFDGDVRLSGPQTMAPEHPFRLGTTTLSLVYAGAAAGGTRAIPQMPNAASKAVLPSAVNAHPAAAPPEHVPAPVQPQGARSLRRVLLGAAGVATLLMAAWGSLRFVQGLLGNEDELGSSGSHMQLAGFRLGMTPDEAVDACKGEILFDHEPLVKESERPPLFNAKGAYVGGPPPAGAVTPPDPGISRAWWDTKNIEPPAGGYMAHMRCKRSTGGHRQLLFTRPPDARLAKITYNPSLSEDRPSFKDYQAELVERYGAFFKDSLFDDGKRHIVQWRFLPQPDCQGNSTSAPDGVWNACLTTKLWAIIDTKADKVTGSRFELESNAEELVKFNRIGPRN